MKIVYFASSTIPSAAANSIQVMKMCGAFSGLGHEVHLLVPERSSSLAQQDYDIFNRYGVSNRFNVHYLRVEDERNHKKRLASLEMVRFSRSIRPDLIYSRNLTASFIALSNNLPLFHELHYFEKPPGPCQRTLNRWRNQIKLFRSFRHASCRELQELRRLGALDHPQRMLNAILFHPDLIRVVAITRSLKSALLDAYPLLAPRIEVAPDGADPPDSDLRPAQLKGPSTALQVGYTGHLYPGKGMEILPSLAERCPWANFHIVGGLEEHLLYWQKALNSFNNVFFYGAMPQRDVSSYIKAFDICLLPNQRHIHTKSAQRWSRPDIAPYTSPLKLFEYMAEAKPIVASDIDVLKEILVDKQNALLCKPDDTSEWAAALKWLKDNGDQANQLGKQAQKEFLDKYTWSLRARRIVAICRDLQKLHVEADLAPAGDGSTSTRVINRPSFTTCASSGRHTRE